MAKKTKEQKAPNINTGDKVSFPIGKDRLTGIVLRDIIRHPDDNWYWAYVRINEKTQHPEKTWVWCDTITKIS